MDKKKLYFIVLIIIIICIELQAIFILNRAQIFFRFIQQKYGQQTLKDLISQHPLIYNTFQFNVFITTAEMILVILALIVLYYQKTEIKFFACLIPLLIIGILITGILFLIGELNYSNLMIQFSVNKTNCITIQCSMSDIFISIRNDFTLYLIANSLSLFFFEVFYIFRMKIIEQKTTEQNKNINQTQIDLMKQKNKQLIEQDISVENMSQAYA